MSIENNESLAIYMYIFITCKNNMIIFIMKIQYFEMGLRSTLIIGTVSGLIICLTIVAIAITLEFATGE